MSNQDSYRKLKQIWYKKLKNSGFNDIESERFPDKEFKGGSTNWKFNSAWTTAYSMQQKQDYYYLATDFMNTYTFDSKVHEAIWAYHAEGLSMRGIAKILNAAKVKNRTVSGRYAGKARTFSKDTVQKIVAKYRDIMKRGIK